MTPHAFVAVGGPAWLIMIIGHGDQCARVPDCAPARSGARHPGIVPRSKVPSGDSLPLEGAFGGSRDRGRLTAMRQMPVIAGPLSPVDAAQDKQHWDIKLQTE
jgi:hypothetical protein